MNKALNAFWERFLSSLRSSSWPLSDPDLKKERLEEQRQMIARLYRSLD